MRSITVSEFVFDAPLANARLGGPRIPSSIAESGAATADVIQAAYAEAGVADTHTVDGGGDGDTDADDGDRIVTDEADHPSGDAQGEGHDSDATGVRRSATETSAGG